MHEIYDNEEDYFINSLRIMLMLIPKILTYFTLILKICLNPTQETLDDSEKYYVMVVLKVMVVLHRVVIMKHFKVSNAST